MSELGMAVHGAETGKGAVVHAVGVLDNTRDWYSRLHSQVLAKARFRKHVPLFLTDSPTQPAVWAHLILQVCSVMPVSAGPRFCPPDSTVVGT